MGRGGRPSFGVPPDEDGRPRRARQARGRRRAVPAARCRPAILTAWATPIRRRWRGSPTAPERQRQGSSKAEGFEASVHSIKEQVLPRLLERVDPEAAATLSKDELAEEFRPIIGEVLAELKINLNRREQFALEKVLVDELLGLGPLEELLADPDVSDIMVNGPNQTYIERKGKLEIARSSSATRSICSRSPSASSTRSAAASTRPPRSPTPASRTAAASTSSSRRCACAAPPSRSVSSPRSRSPST